MGLINMGPAFLAPHLSFLADLFGVRLQTFLAANNMLEADRHMRVYALAGTVLMLFIVTLSLPFLRNWAYEPYLRIHQTLAVGIAFTTVNHLRSIEGYNWTPLYSFGGIVIALALSYVGSTLYCNKKWGYPWPRIVVNLSHGVVLATIKLSRPVTIEPGQYLNLWVPSNNVEGLPQNYNVEQR
ncbi:C6 transcription factor [Purpureocillium lavendulum]|uniref:C6 transcription factor n=1 Tax=Purpureocillium lavendulum TaxID=1247861 RepID=A0AB34FB65_9HYPO|nr:C6 transcription factor [Purpureocillium lavendulum]